MLLKTFLILVFGTFGRVVCGQSMLNRVFIDTLKSGHRTSGYLLDSADCKGFTPIISLPGSLGVLASEFSFAKRFDPSLAFLNNSPALIWRKPSFIALPHLGVSYNFGSNATQQLRAEYEQWFSKTNFLQITYKRETTKGFLQNGLGKATNFQINGGAEFKKYQIFYDGSFMSSEQGENGGVLDKNEINTIGLELSPVRKSANSYQKRGNFNIDQRLNFADSAKTVQGLIHNFGYDISVREYKETPNLKYDTIFHDLNTTRDHFNLAEISNGFGYFMNSKKLYFDVTAQHKYWKQYAIWSKKDTNEAAINSRFSLNLNRFKLSNALRFNFFGAIGEWKNELDLRFIKNKLFTFNSKLLLGASLPNPYQRFNTSNHFQWNLKSPKLQNYQQLLMTLNIPKLKSLFVDLSFLNSVKPYIFDSSEFKQSKLNFTVLSISAGASFYYKTLRIRPTLLLQTGSSLSKLPQFQGAMRIQMIQKWVKKRLPVSYGIDLNYISAYSSYSYLPILNQLQSNNAIVNAGDLLRLHFFFSLEISSFRFFMRVENIDYAWNDRKREVAVNYPILPRMIRLGITWDFFN